MKTIVIGGVAGGMSAATRLRRLDEGAEIVVVERGHYVSYANCGLPYFVGGTIENRAALLLQTPAGLTARFRLDVRIDTEVVAIDRVAKAVLLRDVGTGEEALEKYDSLVLAVGATTRELSMVPSIPTHTLRTVDDVDAIVGLLAPLSPGAVLVVGGGFIGLEAVDNLARRSAHVTLVQRGSHVMSPLDPEMAAPLTAMLRSHGVDVRLNTVVERSADGRVHLSDGTSVLVDLIVEARGVTPNTTLAGAAGLKIGGSGGIWVDEFQRTSDPSIYAVGDGVEKTDGIDGRGTLVTMAGLANRHGRAAADAIARQVRRGATPALGVGIVKLFDTTIAMVGWSERDIVAAGRAHRIVHTHPTSHATYYPGAETMAMKLVIDADTDAILGAQIVGGAGVDKRIDIIAVAMAGKVTASQLAELELAYAPQFGSAKDAVNHAGYVADNLATGTSRNIQWHELADAIDQGESLIDVRDSSEYEAGHIPGAMNIPLNELRERLDELPEGALVVHCQVGQRGHTAARILEQRGRRVRNLDGGYKTWTAGMAADNGKETA